MAKILIALVLGLMALRGVYLLAGGIRGLRRAGSSAEWPRTRGVVVRTDESSDGNIYDTHAVVRYRTGDGKEYSTDRISFGETLNPFDRTRAGLLRERYPDGAAVSVAYDPEEPATAILQPGTHAEVFWPVGVGLAFLLPAILCLWEAPNVVRGTEPSNAASQQFREMMDRARSEGQSELTVPWTPGGPFPMPGLGLAGAIGVATLASLACAFGVIALASGLPKAYYGFASRSWPTTPGEVIVNVGVRAMFERQDLHNRVILPPGFLYQYEVAGTRHVNSIRRFRSVGNAGITQAHLDAPEDLPVGTKVKVAYFPTDPDISALDPGNQNEDFILPGIGTFLLLASFAVFAWGIPALSR